MFFAQQRSGFTMIELLVVIAIIGILASLSLAYLGPARNKGADSAIKANLANAMRQAEIYYTNNNESYEGVCHTTNPSTIGGMINAAEKSYKNDVTVYDDDTESTWDSGQCHDSSGAWAAIVPLKSSRSNSIIAWCVDSESNSGQVVGIGATLAGSGQGQYRCP